MGDSREPLIVSVDFRVDDRWQSVRDFLVTASEIVQRDGCRPWTLDCSASSYLGPDAAVLIAGLYNRDKQQGLHPQVILPQAPAQLDGYCAFVGLKHLVHPDGPRPRPDHPQSETVPLHTYFQSIANAQHKVIELIRRHYPALSEDAENSLGVAINETIQNVCDHAESPIGAMMTARYFRNHGEVRVAILDLGVGIPHTLSKVYAEATDPETALRMVAKGGFSSRSRANNMGLGVSNLVAQVMTRRGELVMLSSGAAITIHADRELQFHRVPVEFPGTAVFFRMPVHDDDD